MSKADPSRHRRRAHRQSPRAVVACLAFTATACVAYEPAPLRPVEVLAAADLARERAPDIAPNAEGTLEALVERLETADPELRRVRARLAIADAVAAHRTPLANPTLTAGPLWLAGGGIDGSDQLGLEAALGLLVPLGSVRSATDALHSAQAQLAHVEAIAAYRDAYLALRRDALTLAAAATALATTADLATLAEQNLLQTRRLADAGVASATDVRLSALEAARASAATLAAREREFDARTALARRLGLATHRIDASLTVPSPDLPDVVPDPATLRGALLRERGDLAVLRLRHTVAEARLALEIERQWPSIAIGPSYERESDQHRYGLGIGIELPLFDRNQQAIARARAERDAARVDYETAMTDALHDVETARTRVALRAARVAAITNELVPAANAAATALEAAVAAGAADGLALLEAARAQRTARLDEVLAAADLAAAYADLEAATGAPLLRFRGEPARTLTPLPSPKESSR